MLDVYKDFYNLTDVPFRLSPDHRYSFEHPSYAQAKAYLEYAIFQGEGFITITGLPGTGKTTLISEILAEVDKSHIRVATVTSTQLDARDFLHMVAASFGLQFGEENKVTLLRALTNFLVQQHRQGLRCVLIVDEAQGLSASALEELRLLANLQHRNKLVLQVCLVGQEQLREVIAAPEMEHLRQRLIASAHLDPLDLDETITYIEHRLVCAGWQGDPAFSEAALRHIYRSSGGIPRRINLICNRMFLHGGLEQQHELGGEDAHLMVNELREETLLAPGEVVSAGGADDPGEKNDDSVRQLPRGEMLAAREAHAQAESLQQPLEQPAADKAGTADGVSAVISPETVSHGQPDGPTTHPTPAPAPADSTDGGAAATPPEKMPLAKPEGPTTHPTPALADSTNGGAAATPPEKMPLAKPEGPTTHPTPALADSTNGGAAATPPEKMPLAQPDGPATQPAQTGARARAGEALRPAPEEPPHKPKGGCLRVVVQVIMALLLAAFIAFMLSMALQKNWFALLKQEQGSHDALRPDTPSVLKSPRATTPREITTPPLPIKRKPRAGTASSTREPYKDENRRAGTAPDGLTPKAKPVADKVKKTPTIQPVDAAIAPPPPPATKTGVVTATPPAAAKQIAPAAKSPVAVAKKVAPADKPPAAIEAQHPPLQDQAQAGVERPATRAAQPPAEAAKPAAQPPAEAAKPAAAEPARQETRVAPAPASPPEPTAVLTQPAITADDIKTALLSGRWNRNGQPASVLPSEVTFCRNDQLVINCWSVPQRSANSEGQATYKVESTLSNFADTGEFHMLDRRLVRPIGADATNDERWHAAEHEMQCKMVKPDTVVCQDRYGNTNDYHISALSR